MLRYFLILQLPPDASDADIRARYLQLVRRYPPEQDPESFQRITAAYEAVKNRHMRVKTQLFDTHTNPEAAILELENLQTITRRRVGLKTLQQVSDRLQANLLPFKA